MALMWTLRSSRGTMAHTSPFKWPVLVGVYGRRLRLQVYVKGPRLRLTWLSNICHF